VTNGAVTHVPVEGLRDGQVLASSVRSGAGAVLIEAGSVVSDALRDRLARFHVEWVEVVVAEDDAAGAAPIPLDDPRDAGQVAAAVLIASSRARPMAARALDAAVGAVAEAAMARAVRRVTSNERIRALLLTEGVARDALRRLVDTGLTAAVTAAAMALDEQDVRDVALAGLLADLGMLFVRPELLAKPGRPTSEEEAEIRRHAEAGGALAELVTDHGSRVPMVVRSHHERVDGTGWPEGLRGRAVDVLVQIVGVAQRFQAGLAPRAFRPALEPHMALEQVMCDTGRLADAPVVKAFATAVAIYPPGTPVVLSDGQAGVAVAGGVATRPDVAVLWDPDGVPVRGRSVALREHRTTLPARAPAGW
jgi:hypothetical protein